MYNLLLIGDNCRSQGRESLKFCIHIIIYFPPRIEMHPVDDSAHFAQGPSGAQSNPEYRRSIRQTWKASQASDIPSHEARNRDRTAGHSARISVPIIFAQFRGAGGPEGIVRVRLERRGDPGQNRANGLRNDLVVVARWPPTPPPVIYIFIPYRWISISDPDKTV